MYENQNNNWSNQNNNQYNTNNNWNNQNNNQYNVNSNQYNESIHNHVMYLVLSILGLLCCCPLTGVIALVSEIYANQDFKAGRMDFAEKRQKVAKVALIVGIVVFVLNFIAVYIIGMSIVNMVEDTLNQYSDLLQYIN
jgi:hypothetical protein